MAFIFKGLINKSHSFRQFPKKNYSSFQQQKNKKMVQMNSISIQTINDKLKSNSEEIKKSNQFFDLISTNFSKSPLLMAANSSISSPTHPISTPSPIPLIDPIWVPPDWFEFFLIKHPIYSTLASVCGAAFAFWSARVTIRSAKKDLELKQMDRKLKRTTEEIQKEQAYDIIKRTLVLMQKGLQLNEPQHQSQTYKESAETYWKPILDHLNQPFQAPDLEKFNGPVFDRSAWNEFLKDDLNQKRVQGKIISLHGPSCSGKTEALKRSLLGSEGVIYIAFRTTEYLAAIKEGINYPFTSIAAGHDMVTVITFLKIALKEYHDKHNSRVLIVLDDLQLSTVPKKDAATTIDHPLVTFLNLVIELSKIHAHILVCCDFSEAHRLTTGDLKGISGYDRLEDMMFPSASDDELKTGLKNARTKPEASADEEIELIVHSVGSNLRDIENVLKSSKKVSDAVNEIVEDAKKKFISNLFKLYVPLSGSSDLKNAQKLANLLYTEFAKEEKPINVLDFESQITDGRLFTHVNWLVQHQFLFTADHVMVIPYSRSLVTAYKSMTPSEKGLIPSIASAPVVKMHH